MGLVTEQQGGGGALLGGVGAKKGDRRADVLGRSERREVPIGALLFHLPGENCVDDDDVRRRLGAGEAVGEGKRPSLGGSLGRGVGSVGIRWRLRLLGGDEDEAAVLGVEE